MKNDLIKSVSKSIKHFRELREMTQYDLADKSGVDRSYISRLELGLANPSLKKIEVLAKALNASVSVLFT